MKKKTKYTGTHKHTPDFLQEDERGHAEWICSKCGDTWKPKKMRRL